MSRDIPSWVILLITAICAGSGCRELEASRLLLATESMNRKNVASDKLPTG